MYIPISQNRANITTGVFGDGQWTEYFVISLHRVRECMSYREGKAHCSPCIHQIRQTHTSALTLKGPMLKINQSKTRR